MRLVTVARKPCAASGTTANVVENQAGALNIDACRIRTEEKMSFSKASPYHDAAGNLGRTWNPTSTPGIEREQHAGGRWPANVLLVRRLDSDAGCPVASLDAQGRAAGSHSAGVAIGPRRSKDKRPGFGNFGTEHVWRFGDEGGVSRFFKQVGP